MIRTAILVDGVFYRKRAYSLFGDKTHSQRADEKVNIRELDRIIASAIL